MDVMRHPHRQAMRESERERKKEDARAKATSKQEVILTAARVK